MKVNPHCRSFLHCLFFGLAGIFLFACDNEDEPKAVPTVTTSTPTEVTTTSAKVKAEITSDGNSSIKSSGFVYSATVAIPTLDNDKADAPSVSGAFNTTIEGLESGTTYHLRAYATNDVGTSYGNVVDFTTGNAAPTVSNVLVTGTTEANKELTATYKYDDAEDDEEGETTFQWYVATSAAGAGEAAIPGATGSKFIIQDAQQEKYIRVGVTPKAKTGSMNGTEVKSIFVGAIGEATTVTFMYNNESVTYGIIVSSTGKKWLDRNLGAENVPSAYNDYANYGDLFQWGRPADGHQRVVRNGPNNADVVGVNGATSNVEPYKLSASITPDHSQFIITGGNLPADWLITKNDNLWQGVNGLNNPCPAGWRIPTKDEWSAENLGTITEAFDKLKITLSGSRSAVSGNFTQASLSGRYWSSTFDAESPDFIVRTGTDNSGTTFDSAARGGGFPCRCIKD